MAQSTFMNTGLPLFTDEPFRVADLSEATARYGRKDLQLSEVEMPGLMSLREELGAAQPLKGARITGSLYMTVQTALLIQTLTALSAEVRWARSTLSSTQAPATATVATAPPGTS